jgi:hypothetical protein
VIAARFMPKPVAKWCEGQGAGLKVRCHLPSMPKNVGDVVDAIAQTGDNAHQRSRSS